MSKIIAQFSRVLLIVLFLQPFYSCTTQDNVQPDELQSTVSAADAKSIEASEPIKHYPQCPVGYVWDPEQNKCVVKIIVVDPCESVYSGDLAYRNRVISSYGASGGLYYDKFKAAIAGKDLVAVLASYNWTVYSYSTQIRNAIYNGSNAYVSSVSSTTNYSATAYLAHLNNYLNPLKNTITNDPSLTANQKTALLQVFVAIQTNFNGVSNTITSKLDCFPYPAGLSANGLDVSRSGWLGKALKKVVNAVATVLVSQVYHAVTAAIAAVDAVLFPDGGLVGILLMPAAIVVGAAVGSIYGTFVGIRRVVQGDYVCVFQGVGNCI